MGKVTIGAAEPLVNPVLLQAIVFTACSFSGTLAGIDIDGCSVRFPAWRHLGAAAWLKRSGNDTQVVEDAFEGLRAGASFAPLLRCLHLPARFGCSFVSARDPLNGRRSVRGAAQSVGATALRAQIEELVVRQLRVTKTFQAPKPGSEDGE